MRSSSIAAPLKQALPRLTTSPGTSHVTALSHNRSFSSASFNSSPYPSTSTTSSPSSPSAFSPFSPSSASSSSSPSSPSSGPTIRTRNPAIDRMLRVDHAGEYAAQCIYRGQLAALAIRSALSPSSSSSSSSPTSLPNSIRLITEMRDQEIEHLRTIERLIPLHHTRPTLLLPLWHLAGYTLGAATALLGTRAAMACTVAVEEVITEHYNDQLRELASDEFKEGSSGGRVEEEEVMELRRVIRKHRDEEEEHRDIGLENEAEMAPAYALLTNVIKAGCQAAINVAKVI